MKPLKAQPGLTEQVYQALLDAMADGGLEPGQHLVQEQIATELGVSRQPVQQALALLKNEGLVRELGGRGLFVAPIDPATMRERYEVRAVLDGLAARRAAERARGSAEVASALRRAGGELVAMGRAAVAKTRISAMIQCDVAFHEFLYEASGNPLIAQTASPHWRQLRRVMGEVLRHAEPPATIWCQHQEILDAVVAGDPTRAERAAIDHVWTAAKRLETSLSTPPRDEARPRHATRKAR